MKNPNTDSPYTISEIISITQAMLMALMQMMQIVPNLKQSAKACVVGKKVFDIIEREPLIKDEGQEDDS